MDLPEYITLSTWHNENFSLTSGRVQWQLSEHYQDMPELRKAYAILKSRLKTDQIIWCSVDQNENPWPGRIEHQLLVPRDEVLAYYDDAVWHRLIGEPVTFPRWREEARRKYPQNSLARRRFLLDRKNEYDLPKNELWDRLFVTPFSPPCFNGIYGAILKRPVNPDWIKTDNCS